MARRPWVTPYLRVALSYATQKLLPTPLWARFLSLTIPGNPPCQLPLLCSFLQP